MTEILMSILVPTGLLTVIALVVFLVSRVRAGGFQEISVRVLLTCYFYLVIVVSLIVTLAGFSTLVKAGLGSALGREFSYYRSTVVKPLPPPPSPAGEPVRPAPEQPSEEEQRQRQQREVEASFRGDLLQGLSATVIGGLVWLVHVFGRRRFETDEERRESLLNRAYLFLLLAIFSVVGVISAAQGVYETLRFYLVESVEPYAFQSPPGDTLATAIVFVPVWVYYLNALIRERRATHTVTEESQS
ncbi:MAG: DUF5671 domain-containing protein [Chloroflexota bacterium]